MSRSKVGIALLAVCALCASSLLVPVAAAGQTASSATAVQKIKTVPISGTGKNGKTFTGRYTITHFETRHGKPYAVGTLVGKLGKKRIRQSDVAIPVGVQHSGLAGTAAVCPVLHLVLGPLNLNLLGLHVHLNQVVLDITAVSGPGNLLGNLLCGVANLLNGTGATSAPTTTGLLNILQQLLNVPTLSSL